MELSSEIITAWMGSLLWPFFRIGGFLMVAPVVSSRLVPANVRIILALLLTMTVAPSIPQVPFVELFSVDTFFLIVQQLLIGIAMATVLQVLMQLFVMAGNIIGMQMALGFAQMVDPVSGVSVPALSQFHLMLATMLFVTMNGHLLMIEVLVNSFYVLPVGGGFLSTNALWQVVDWMGWMFSAALLMALPALAAMLIINFALGVITKAAPQLNIFAIGFPFMLIIGLCIVWVMMSGYVPLFEQFSEESFDVMNALVTDR